jgi:hypothetical protein
LAPYFDCTIATACSREMPPDWNVTGSATAERFTGASGNSLA